MIDCRVQPLLLVLRLRAEATLSRSSRGCTRRRGSIGSTGRSTGRSRRSGAQTSRVRLLVRAERRSDQQYVKLNLVPESP